MAGVRRSLDIASFVWVVLLITMAVLVICIPALASPPRYELVKRFGPDGTGSSGFERPGPVAVDQQSHLVYAAAGLPEGGPGSLYKFDSEGNPVNWGGVAPYISGNEISGIQLAREGERQVAVDSSSHVIYVTSANSIRAFQADGEPSEFSAGPGAGSSSIGGFTRLTGIAVDPNGYFYASDFGSEPSEGIVKIFAPSGEEIDEFAVEAPANLAVDSAGAVYVTQLFGATTKFTASIFPVTSATAYTAGLEPVDPGPDTTVGVNPTTNDVYIAHSLGAPGVAVYTESGTLITTFGEPGSDGELFLADGVAIDGGSTKVYVGNQPSEALGLPSQVYVFQPEPPTAPKIENRGVSSISSTSAIFYARINPDQRATTYWFEYGPDDCSTSVCTTIPLGGTPIEAGNDGVLVSQKIQSLSPGVEYHYRVVAENEKGKAFATGTFKTQAGGSEFALADRRLWEMVSPPDKHGSRLLGPFDGQVQAAADGNGIVYLSRGSIEDGPDGNRFEAASNVARRGPAGWMSKDITTPNAEVTPIAVGQFGEYKMFSADLSQAVIDQRSEIPLSDEASERAPYLWEDGVPPVYRPLVTGKEGFANVPPETSFGGPALASLSEVLFRAASPDFRHVVLSSNVPLVDGAPNTPGYTGLYEWAEGQLRSVSILPAAEGATFVPANGNGPGSGQVSMRHAVSDDGSRVFWTGLEAPYNHLYMRDFDAGESIRIDQVQSGLGTGEEEPVFQGASADGTIVFFSDRQQLTEDASPSGADLYRCEIVVVADGCTNLVDLTAPPSGTGGSGRMLGVVSSQTDDGSRVYFVAEGVLDAEENQFGQTPGSSKPNLYLWEESRGLRFIATLAPGDSPNWGVTLHSPREAENLAAISSPDGRYFAFMSERDLSGRGNVDVLSGEPVEEIFRFDAETGRLACVSCPPDGAAPRGTTIKPNQLVDSRGQWYERKVAATLPEPTALSVEPSPTVYRPRAVLDNGRVFFNSFDSLVPADSNGQWDTYQYEDFGIGDCGATSGNAAVERSGEGCVSMISSGTGETEAAFLDASVSGDDAFFLTRARLSVTDVDNELDVYDARVNGTPATLIHEEECGSGESCHPAVPPGQNVTPGSSSFNGAGNIEPGRKCPKGKRKVKKSGKQRCVPRKGKKHHRRASQRKGVGR